MFISWMIYFLRSQTPRFFLTSADSNKKDLLIGTNPVNKPFLMSPPGFEPGTPRLKVVRFLAFPWLNENRNAVFMGFIGCFSLRYLIIYVWSATNNGRRLVFHLLRREVIDMVTFTDLFTYTLVLCAVVTLVVTCCNKPKK